MPLESLPLRWPCGSALGSGGVRAGRASRLPGRGSVGGAPGIGLAVVGVPFAVALTAVMFLLAIVQVGATPVLLCAVAWLYWTGSGTWANVLLVWAVPVALIDNFLRPILIKQGVDLPMLLVIAGVVGGLLAFGLIGIFVGPV